MATNEYVMVERKLLETAVSVPSKASVDENLAGIVERGRAQAEIRATLDTPQPPSLEEVEVVGYMMNSGGRRFIDFHPMHSTKAKAEPLMTVAQHQRIDAARLAEIELLREEHDKAWRHAGLNLQNLNIALAELSALQAELAGLRGSVSARWASFDEWLAWELDQGDGTSAQASEAETRLAHRLWYCIAPSATEGEK